MGSPRVQIDPETPSLKYAENTATPVIEVADDSFYAVQNGVWFTLLPQQWGHWAPWPTTTVPGVNLRVPPRPPHILRDLREDMRLYRRCRIRRLHSGILRYRCYNRQRRCYMVPVAALLRLT